MGNNIKSIGPLAIGQSFWYQGVEYKATYFPSRKSVCGKNSKPRSGEPNEIKVSFKDILLSPPMTEADRMYLLDLVVDQLTDKDASFEKFQEFIHDYMSLGRFRPDIALRCSSEVTGVPEKSIRGKSRKDEIVLSRYIIYYYLFFKGATLEGIGKYFDKSHCSVLHGRNQFIDWVSSNDKGVIEKYELFQSAMKRELANERKKYAQQFLAMLCEINPTNEN